MEERGRRKQGIATSKPATGIDDIHPKSSFFHLLPGETRRIHDSARGRVWNWACAPPPPPPPARAVIQNRGWRGVIHRTPLE